MLTIDIVDNFEPIFNRLDVTDRNGEIYNFFLEDFDGFVFTDGTDEIEVTETVMADVLENNTIRAIKVTANNELVVEDADAFNQAVQAVVDAELAKVADNYDIDAETANGNTGDALEATVQALVEADVDTNLVNVSVEYDSGDDFNVTLTSVADDTIDNTKSVTAVVVPGAVDATKSGATSSSNGDGTADITVTVADEYGNAIKDLVEADFTVDNDTEDYAGTITSVTNNDDGTYTLVVDAADNVNVTVDGVEVESGLTVTTD